METLQCMPEVFIHQLLVQHEPNICSGSDLELEIV
jgi:hypothetical protein